LELHEKIFVDSEFLDTTHGEIGCAQCHGGDNTLADWRKAHRGVHRDPSASRLAEACGECHEDEAKTSHDSLHFSLRPFFNKVMARTDPTDSTTIHGVMAGFTNHCTQCHASCGQCHISRPDALGGGFLEAHLFQKKPPQSQTCTACHGSRLQKEYEGKNEGIPADVHKKKKWMKCSKCHTGDEMHAATEHGRDRHDASHAASCLDCHEDVVSPDNAVEMHQVHGRNLQCQVCHSLPYKNCAGCHVGKDKHGLTYFKLDKTWMAFKIGKNTRISPRRPYRFAVVRHVPVSPELFDYYVKNGLTNFDAAPTWKLAAPHTIQRNTPQAASCDACHGHPELFLRSEDVDPELRKANKKVILSDDEVPARQE